MIKTINNNSKCSHRLLFSFSFILFLCLFSLHSVSQEIGSKIRLVAFGGGKISQELRKEFLSYSPAEEPNLLVISYASEPDKVRETALRNQELFKKAGAQNIRVLDLSDRKKALQDIKWCDVIWMSGGSQVRLREALEEADVVADIQRHFQMGGLIGGNSAGASIMSTTMMANAEIDEKTKKMYPVISYGLKLWDNVIIDQHFNERNRLQRLEIAIEKHPDQIGVGIDERTGIAYDGENSFFVIGKGQVTVLHNKEKNSQSTLEKTTLKKGDKYSLNR